MVKFLCNNFWQTRAHHHFDLPHETKHLYVPRPFVPEEVKNGQVVFVKTDLLDIFLAHVLPRIPTSFVLITGHSDLSPSLGAMEWIQSEPRIVRWYALNIPWDDFKTQPIPLGLSEPDRPIGDQDIVEECMGKIPAVKTKGVFFPSVAPTHPIRQQLVDLDHPFLCKCNQRLSYRDYLTELSKHKYVLCPRGNGIDVHRVYEAILMRTIPIYFSDHVPALFRKLPVVIVQSIQDLMHVLEVLSQSDHEEQVDWAAAQKYLLADNVAHMYGINIPDVSK